MYQVQPGPLLWVQMNSDSVGPEVSMGGLAGKGAPFKAKNAKVRMPTPSWKGPMQVRALELELQKEMCVEKKIK